MSGVFSGSAQMHTCMDRVFNADTDQTDSRIVSGLFIFEDAPENAFYIEQNVYKNDFGTQVMNMCYLSMAGNNNFNAFK